MYPYISRLLASLARPRRLIKASMVYYVNDADVGGKVCKFYEDAIRIGNCGTFDSFLDFMAEIFYMLNFAWLPRITPQECNTEIKYSLCVFSQ